MVQFLIIVFIKNQFLPNYKHFRDFSWKKIKNCYFSEQPKCCVRVQKCERNPETDLMGFLLVLYLYDPFYKRDVLAIS